MQSDSDSEGEFFDAAESQNNSFDVGTLENTKKVTIQGKNINIKDGQHDKNETNKKQHSPGKLKPSTSSQEQSTIPGDSKSLDPKDENVFDSSLNNYEDSSKKDEPQERVQNVQKPRVRNLELNLEKNINETKLLEISSGATSLPLLSPVSQLIKEVVNDESLGSDVVESGNRKVAEVEAPAPVAPPRRKRKKKPEVKSLSEAADKVDDDTKHKESTTPENPSSPVSTPDSPKLDHFSSDPPLPPSEKTTSDLTTVTNTLEDADENDPAITLDYKSQEMKKVLEKASSTEVIHALTLDTRLKSHSVTSLGSSCNRSDSFASVSSVISNGQMNNISGSTASVGSTHSYQYSSGDKRGGLVRVRSASGRPLSDAEILEQVIVKNLDTGERIPLSLAEDRLPKGTNPLALHIMRLTSEFSSSNPKLNAIDHEDGVDVSSKVKKKSKKLKKFLGRTVNKMKADKKTKEAHAQKGEDSSSSEDEDGPTTPYIKIKSAHGKGPEEFEKLKLLQDLSGEHVGAIWT
ncbi:WD repeat-containing protein 44-like, partial [Actinia tenebrosa]|uniref:WD repeat-containing protein 44-like n=1 Tax=Actinia tenebrosa TaxID=6105 RepID=A0A6P8IAD6_ACTTE